MFCKNSFLHWKIGIVLLLTSTLLVGCQVVLKPVLEDFNEHNKVVHREITEDQLSVLWLTGGYMGTGIPGSVGPLYMAVDVKDSWIAFRVTQTYQVTVKCPPCGNGLPVLPVCGCCHDCYWTYDDSKSCTYGATVKPSADLHDSEIKMWKVGDESCPSGSFARVQGFLKWAVTQKINEMKIVGPNFRLGWTDYFPSESKIRLVGAVSKR